MSTHATGTASMAALIQDINVRCAEPMRYASVDRLMRRVIWGHFVVLSALAGIHVLYSVVIGATSPFGWHGVGPLKAGLAVSVGLVLALSCSLLHSRLANHFLWRMLVTVSLTGISALFSFVSNGAIELQFHYFLVAAFVSMYADWRLPVAVAAIVTSYEITMGQLRPEWVYDEGANALEKIMQVAPLPATTIFLALLCVTRRATTLALIEARRKLEADIARREEAELELDRTRAELAASQKLSALGTLVSGVAHEVRTPLTYLQTNVYLARRAVTRGAESNAPAAQVASDADPFLRAAEEAVDRINRLVSDLRRFTKLESQAHVRAGLHEVVPDAIDLFLATQPGKVNLVVELVPTRHLTLDKAQIQQVVLNLLHNAVDASPPGAPVTVRTRDGFAGGELVVEDQGSGIAPEVRGRLFEPFTTTKPEGTGLGLSIVRRIVEAHGGSIDFETRAGRGTRFVVRIPDDPTPPHDEASGGRRVPVTGSRERQAETPPHVPHKD